MSVPYTLKIDVVGTGKPSTSFECGKAYGLLAEASLGLPAGAKFEISLGMEMREEFREFSRKFLGLGTTVPYVRTRFKYDVASNAQTIGGYLSRRYDPEYVYRIIASAMVYGSPLKLASAREAIQAALGREVRLEELAAMENAAMLLNATTAARDGMLTSKESLTGRRGFRALDLALERTAADVEAHADSVVLRGIVFGD